MQAQAGQPSNIGELAAQRREFEADHRDFLRNLARGEYLRTGKPPDRYASHTGGPSFGTAAG